MLLLLGSEHSELAAFGRKVANDYLKTDLKVLNRSTFKDLQPKMDKNTPIVLEKGFTIGEHQQELQKMIKERNIIILVKDCEPDSLLGYAIASSQGNYVVVKNSLNGHEKHVSVMNNIAEAAKSMKHAYVAEGRSDEMCVLASNTKIHGSDMLDRECCWKKIITIRLVDFSQEPKGDPGDPAYLNKGQIQAFFLQSTSLSMPPRTHVLSGSSLSLLML